MNDVKNGSSLASYSLVPHLATLRFTGYCRLSAKFRKKYLCFSAIHDVFRLMQVLNVLLYTVLQAVLAYQIRSDMNNLTKVMGMFLCCCMSVPQHMIFFLQPGRIDQLLTNLDEPYFNEDTEKSKSLMTEAALSAKRLHHIYIGTAVITCILWLLFPVVEFVKGQQVQFAFWCGGEVRPDETLRFILLASYFYYTTTSLGLANTTMDVFVGTIMLQCCTQIKIIRYLIIDFPEFRHKRYSMLFELFFPSVVISVSDVACAMLLYLAYFKRSNFESLIETAKKELKESPENFETITMRLLVRGLIHYRKVIDTYKLLQELFGWTILVVFTIGAWCLCTSVYQLSTLNLHSIDFFSMNLFNCCIFTELFVYCYYGNEVTLESAKLNESLYMMDWINAPRRVQRAMVIVMERAKRPLRPMAGGLVPLSIGTFVGILRSSYSFYAVLRQSAKE